MDLFFQNADLVLPFIVSFLGACLGSFTTLLIYRLHHDEPGVIAGRSKCPKCEKTLTWYQLIPIFSWLFQGGKCGHCRSKISIRYPLIELTFAICFYLFTQKFIGSPELVGILLIVFFFLVLFFYDLLYLEVDERIVLPFIAGLIIWSFFREETWSLYLIGGICGFLFYWGQYFVSKGVWVGAGDMRLGAAMGLVLGWKLFFMALFLAYIIGCCIAIPMMLLGKANRKTQLPMGAFLMPATLIFLYAGPEIFEWYFSFNRFY